MRRFSDEAKALFSQLLSTPSPSGYEHRIGALIKEFAIRYCDEVQDYHGNVVALQRGTGNRRIMIAAHMDEVGMLIKGILEDGMLCFTTIGSVDIGLLPGLRVSVWHNDVPVHGVIGRKAVHLLDDTEKMNINPKELWIDIGYSTREEAEGRVTVGDTVTFADSVTHLPNNTLCARGLDNKAGILAITNLMQTMARRKRSSDSLLYVFTTQEEIGCRGMQMVAGHIDIEEAYIIDAIHATDYPGVNRMLHGDIGMGSGAVVSIAPEVSKNLSSRLISAAQNHKIPYQLDIRARCTNTEASFAQLSRSMPHTAVVSIPIRYMHSPNEICSVDDIERVSRLIESVLNVE